MSTRASILSIELKTGTAFMARPVRRDNQDEN